MTIIQDLIDEVKYIKSINPKKPGEDFLHSPSCFARYCDLQLRKAIKHGYVLIADEILEIRDCAIHFTGMIRKVWIKENNGYE
jgi:hypothetical protein